MENAGTFRRLAAAAYDGMLLAAVLMIVTALTHLLTHGEAITRARVGGFEYAYQGLVVACVFSYYASAWTRRGQTLGMKAWAIRLETESGGLPSLGDVALRLAIAAPLYLLAIAGVLLFMAHKAGWLILAALFLPLLVTYGWHTVTGSGTLHDRLSHTRVARLPASPAAAPA